MGGKNPKSSSAHAANTELHTTERALQGDSAHTAAKCGSTRRPFLERFRGQERTTFNLQVYFQQPGVGECEDEPASDSQTQPLRQQRIRRSGHMALFSAIMPEQ